jgi:DNA gyrase/topoisomerase IV subunit B
MTCSKEEFFKNEECKAIYTILDCGEGRRCDVNKCKFEKIIFLGDGDYDGLHIRNLLLKMFLVYYRPLVEAGRVYAAVPPLYSIPLKNGDRQYFTDKSDFVQYVYKTFSKSNVVKDSSGKKISDEKVVDLLTNNINYVSDMDVLSKNHAIDPNLLEFIYSRILLEEKLNRIQKEAKKIYPYLDIKQDNGKMVLDGLVNNGVETVIFHESMLKDCKDSIAHYVMNSDPNGYYLNDKKVSLFELMQEFNGYIPPRLTRYKGLGEMLASELAISTLHPDFNRTLIRYTTNDIEKEIQQIRETDSNMKSLLENVDIAGFDL